MDLCVVFVSNKKYFNKFLETCKQLITNGKYCGNICLVIGNDLNNSDLMNNDFIQKNGIIVKYFPDIQFSDNFHDINTNWGKNVHRIKIFQWHKLYLFDVFFKQWNYIFYIDCGMKIYSDISPIINIKCEKTLLAHSDAYPTYKWKLHNQFDKSNNEYFTNLSSLFNLNIDYFQTTMMLYDTSIINNSSFNNLLNLSEKYPISKTNDQGIIALYFTLIEPYFKQIQTHNENTYFYDYLSRNKNNKYIMLKS
jgi:hypothetical protein